METLHLILSLPPDSLGNPHLLPTLDKLQARGLLRTDATSLSEILSQGFGLARQRDWPIAPLSAARDGLETDGAFWLRADPVHLEAGMQGMFLRDGLALSQAESQALAQSLVPLLAEQGVAFAAPGPSSWYLKFPAPQDLATTPLDRARGRQAMNFLPEGTDAPRLMRLINEVQMLLHAHPLNQAREQAGVATVNSLWPWGGGTTAPLARCFDAVWGQHPLLLDLAHASGTPAHPCPSGLRGLGNPAKALVVLTPEGAEQSDSEYLARLEQDWLRPLLRGLQWGRIRHLALTLLAPEATHIVLGPLHSWRLWAGAKTRPEAPY